MRSIILAAVAALAVSGAGSAYAATCGTPQHHCVRALHAPTRKTCLTGYVRRGSVCIPPHSTSPPHPPVAPHP